MARVALAYSGGLDTSVAISWLKEEKGLDVVACAVDVGQSAADICNLRERHIWEPVEYAIMPNHIHLLVALTESSLRPTMISFKRWTAGKAIAMLGLKTRPFWQEEWFDHWVRTDLEYTRIIEYIRANPVKAGLVRDYRDWPHGSWNEQTILNQEEAPK